MFKKVIIGFFCFLILAVVGVGTYLYTLNWNKHKATVAKRLSEINERLNTINSNNTLYTHESTVPSGTRNSLRSQSIALESEKMNLELQLKKAGYNPRKVVENYTEQARIKKMQEDEKKLAQNALKHPVATSIASILTQPAEIVGAIKTATNAFTNTPMNESVIVLKSSVLS